MIDDLDGIDWASMSHAYGPADGVPGWLRAMASPDPQVRERAFGDFYGAAHHQGDVYSCTALCVPHLFALAADSATPDRAAVAELLLSIGREAAGRGDEVCVDPDGTESTACGDSCALMRERVDALIAFTSDPDPRVRRAGIEGVGLFLDDVERAVALLRERLAAEGGITERLLIVHTTADLAIRLPYGGDSATGLLYAWSEAAEDPGTRLAALVHRARCAPEEIGEGTVTTAIGLLRDLTSATATDPEGTDPSGACVCADEDEATDVPPQIAAAFADLDRFNRVHAPTTSLLRTFHAVLDGRLPERRLLLAEQLRSPDAGTRYDAIRTAQDLITTWRGDHSRLVTLLAGCLLPDDPYTAAAAAESLGRLAPVCEPAREALASYVAGQRAAHGPGVWAAPRPVLRRAHQEAVMALARLGDPRALPDLLTGLDSGRDIWRAIEVCGHLPSAAGELTPRLCRILSETAFSAQGPDLSTGALISTLAALGDPGAVPALAEAAGAAVRHERWRTAACAVDALASFGPRAAPAPPAPRPRADPRALARRAAAAAALWDIGQDATEAVPRLSALLATCRNAEAADALGRIGASAAPALTRLRPLLEAGYDWTRVHAAAALWDIGGEPEAETVLDTLLTAWDGNDATAPFVLSCLDRMGPAAAPARARIEAELELPRRSVTFQGVAADEKLQDACHTILVGLDGPESIAAIRQWARVNGFAVHRRGRIPAPVRESWSEVRGHG
ncbi:Lsr2 family protein [Streptomyces sp. N35]|uniref:Lsr2 family DNA-binding protein n=1 Tax=Streptomyces sp. N35 TaxID=2795730 RepID=UPI0018F3DDEB|nr:Lsr2 family protein [Streptomyces sp. N35]